MIHAINAMMSDRQVTKIAKITNITPVVSSGFSHSPNISGWALQPVGLKTGPQFAPLHHKGAK